jgi:tRNA threonylcarbamoyladenosine modification (KEOPS) complex Cgi121 subunit
MLKAVVEKTPVAFGGLLLPARWSFPESALAFQLVDTSRVYGKRHVLHCAAMSLKAFSRGNALAESQSLDLLMRFAGIRQIGEAIEACKPHREAVLVVIGKGAEKEFKRIVKSLGAKEKDSLIKSREGELDAMERAVLVAL